MKLYLTQAGRWSGTQADARLDGSFEQIEVPTDKPGLLDWLNNREQGNCYDDTFLSEEGTKERARQTLDLLDGPVGKPQEQPEQPPAQAPNWKADSVLAWLLDSATPAQVEQVFAALGARFHEATK